VFLSSPFSVEAADMLDRVGMEAWKIASGEVGSTQLIDRILATGRPVFLSTGLITDEELDAVVARVVAAKSPVAVLQCTTAYPSTPETTGLNAIAEYRRRYGCPAGLSDHSGTIYPALGAAALGVEIVEVHVTLSRAMFGPDVPASVTPSELRQLTEGVRFLERARRAPVNRGQLDDATRELRRVFGKNVVAKMPIPAGTTLTEAHLAARKAGGGLPASALPSLVGRRTRRPVEVNEPIRETDLEKQV
jgi:N,N'-diacetyllegionaminate synthase